MNEIICSLASNMWSGVYGSTLKWGDISSLSEHTKDVFRELTAEREQGHLGQVENYRLSIGNFEGEWTGEVKEVDGVLVAHGEGSLHMVSETLKGTCRNGQWDGIRHFHNIRGQSMDMAQFRNN